jgi:2-iminobutanoate/2-iminopropanoate deaminase
VDKWFSLLVKFPRPSTGEIVGAGDVAKQTAQVIANIEAILTASGAKFQDVVKPLYFW